VEFRDEAPAAGRVEAYLDGLRPNARIVPGLLSNPMARTNWRSVAHARLMRLLPDVTAGLETPSCDSLGAALNYLLFERGANVMIVNGGDGTIHHTLNAAVRVTARAAAVVGRPIPLPRFLFVRGGGMNMLAGVFQSRGHPVRTVRRFLDAARGTTLGGLPTREVPLLSVREPDGAERLGYIFGSELVYNALTMYERFGQGYRGLSRFLWEVARGYAFRTELWYRYGHLLDAPETPLVVDDTVYPRYTSVVATTVPLQLAKGAVGTIRRMASPGQMNVVCVLPTDKEEVIRSIPRLMLGAPGPGLVYREDARAIALYGSYTLDGERVTLPGPGARDAPSPAALRVTGSAHSVRGVWLP